MEKPPDQRLTGRMVGVREIGAGSDLWGTLGLTDMAPEQN